MEEKYRKIIDHHSVEIRRVLSPDQVLPYFIQEGVMSDDEIAEIRAQTTRHKKADVFMDVLKRSSQGSFDVFVGALEKIQAHLACLLLRSELEELKGEVCAMRVNQVLKQERDVSKRNEKLSEENGKLKSECKQLKKLLQEATATSTRHQSESTPDSVDGATSPADLPRSDFEVAFKIGSVTDLHIASLAQEIANDWMKLGFALGLEKNLLDAIKANHSSVNEQSNDMLFKWKHKQGRRATYENLAEALDDQLVQRRDLVEKHCLESYSSTETPKREGKGFRPTSAKIRAQLTRETKVIEDFDKKTNEMLESADGDTEKSSNTMMEGKHRKLLRRFKKELLKDLDGLRCLPHMVDVLDQTDEDEIKAEATRVKQCDKLLEILPRRGPMAFTSFTKALLEVQPHLGHMLLQVD